MAVVSLEGIIVKRSNFGEADRILTIITPNKGKITVLAKGVRRITSRRGGNVELLNKIKFQIFQGTGMPILTEAEGLETFPKIKSDLLLTSYASYLAELTNKILPEDQPNITAYQLLNAALTLLEKNPRQIFIRGFEVKLLVVMGFWGGVRELGEACLPAGKVGEIRVILDKLEKGSWQEISEMVIKPEESLAVERVLRYYIEDILETKLKSVQIIEKLKGKT